MAKLYLDMLASRNNVKAIRDALLTPLQGFDGMYDDVIHRIRRQVEANKHLAEKALSWVAYAHRPLSAIELRHALCLPQQDEVDPSALPDMEIVISVCLGMLTVDQTSQVVRLMRKRLWCSPDIKPLTIYNRLHGTGIF